MGNDYQFVFPFYGAENILKVIMITATQFCEYVNESLNETL